MNLLGFVRTELVVAPLCSGIAGPGLRGPIFPEALKALARKLPVCKETSRAMSLYRHDTSVYWSLPEISTRVHVNGLPQDQIHFKMFVRSTDFLVLAEGAAVLENDWFGLTPHQRKDAKNRIPTSPPLMGLRTKQSILWIVGPCQGWT